jgi:hypothetical protein
MSEGVVAEGFGGGEYGRRMADMITRIKFDLPLDDLAQPVETEASTDGTVKADQGRSK